VEISSLGVWCCLLEVVVVEVLLLLVFLWLFYLVFQVGRFSLFFLRLSLAFYPMVFSMSARVNLFYCCRCFRYYFKDIIF
jgi:hypothetical protein